MELLFYNTVVLGGIIGPFNSEQVSFSARLWETRGVTALDNRVPKHNDPVTVEGRQGNFFVIGIDLTHQTVEVTTVSAPDATIKDVPWTTVSYVD